MVELKRKSKEINTFRFKSFGDRVSEIDIRRLALYHIGHENEELPDDNETYFHQTLKKWMVLNLSDEFGYFSRKCLKIVTLPQLIYQKDFVVDLLLERLATATNLSLQPLLELLYVLARDLRDEFYPYFQRVLDRLICLLNTQDAELLEWTFVCLAYLFKTLKPYLKKNIGVVFHAILPLLDEQRYEEHITNFAVECFSFIARDIRDYGRFLDFILETVSREQVSSVQGCGRLLFEIVRGVKGLFHSVAGEFLQFIFESLIDEKRKSPAKSQLLCDIVSHAVQELLRFIHPNNMSLFWTKLCAVAQATTAKGSAKISNLIAIFLLAAQYRDGRFLAELDVVVTTILRMLDNCVQAKETHALQLLAQLVSKILLSCSTQLTQLDTSRLLKKMMTIEDRVIFEQFILLIVTHAQFEILILPTVIAYFERNFDLKSMELMVKIVLKKQPIASNAVGLQNWQPYAIHLKQATTLTKIATKLKQLKIANLKSTTDMQEMEEQLLLLLLVQHVCAFDKDILEDQLKAEATKLIKSLNDDAENLDKILIILSVVLETLINLKFKLSSDFLQNAVQALLPHVENIKALGCLDQLVTQDASTALLQDRNDGTTPLTNALTPLLSSHNHTVRLTAAHCLQTMYKSVSQASPYKIFYEAECIEPNVYNYREQLLLLQKLEIAGEFYKTLTDDTYKVDVLRFLLGMLYYNFKMVWQPVLKLIEEYSKVMNINDFWNVYKQKLIECAEGVADYADVGEDGDDDDAAGQRQCTEYWHCVTLNEIFPPTQPSKLTQQEHLNYRNLLWSRLANFGQVTEIKNRDLVTLFMQFVDEEYRKQLERREYTWNLSVSDKAVIDYDDDVNDDDDDVMNRDDDEPSEDIKQRVKKHNKRKRAGKQNTMTKSILQTLQSKMSIFIGQPNPKALYREQELYALYMDLLAGPNPQLQKLALDCVMAYKMKALMPYKEQLYAIIDELKFKDQLIHFKLDTVSEEYREDLMRILLRLLYGKMITKGTQRTISSQARKALILRFLGQCTTAEIMWFLHMAFGKYAKYVKSEDIPVYHIPAMVKENFNLHAVYSAKKLQNIVNLLELIRKEFGGLMQSDFHVYTIKLLIFVGSVCGEVLAAHSSSTQMYVKMPIVYKNVKSAALQSLVNFFTHIDNFDWQTQQVDCVIDVFVRPIIEKLHHDCIHTPTPLLKLLLQWGEKQTHFEYLNRKCKSSVDGQEYTLFHYIIALLLNERAKPAVRKPIMALIERLLLSCSELNKNHTEVGAIGLEIVKPYIPDILKRLKMNFSTRSARSALDNLDLSILTLLTTYVEDASTCDSLLQLLLPILIAKSQTNASEEVVCQVITTLSNLIKRLDEPELYLRKIAPLFEQVQEVNARKMLCQLVADIAKQRWHKQKGVEESSELCTRLRDTARLIHMLNAWDKRWVEQPDYDKRLDALKEITQKLDAGTVDIDLGVLIIYNCFYFIKYDKDMGLRDNAGEHLRVLLPKLTKKYAGDRKQLDYLVGDVFINLVRRIIRDTNDNVRNEGVRLLGQMARECPDAHEILMDLAPLGDRQDDEVDFFENIIHLQSHRHGRALLKFCSHAESLTKVPSVRTLTQFILPLASRYLLHEKHVGKHTLIDAAIETVGVVCQLLPWQHYITILRYYLMKMRSTHDYQKHCVRIVVRILDAFHFDLSQSQTDEKELQKLKDNLMTKDAPADDKKPVVEKIGSNDNNDDDDDDDDDDQAQIKEELTLDAELAQTDEGVEDEMECDRKPVLELILKKPLLLSPSASKRVLATITTILIPTLNRSITEKSSYDTKHKVNRKRFSAEREEEEILRVPIALALVKLMQKLPKELLDTSLPGVFMKVCTFLRSQLKSVRMLTRDILKKIMLTLGSSYLAMLMDHLQNLLTHGFQVHVLSVTLHGVLDAIRDQLQPGDIESCLRNILEVALNDIFGEITAEKEVEKIAAHTPEAKPSAKSYLVLHIVARNIQESCLLDLLMPFREHLARSHSRKVTLKIQDCFAKIVGGLVENAHISRESLLIFIYGTISESITDLLPGTQKRVLSDKEKEKMRRSRPDCFLIPAAPTRKRPGTLNRGVKTNAQANAHILIEFGLDMLHIVLKRKKLTEVDYEPFLNPILPLLRDSLKSTHIRVTTFTLKCFTSIWNEGYQLPSIKEYIRDVVKRLFEILKNLSTFGATKQEDNMQLVKSTLKAMVALIRNYSGYMLSPEQIDQLILYIEQDLHEGENQTMTFSLLKAMLARKVDSPAVHEIMKRMSDLTIISQSDFVRDEARTILVTYVMEYHIKKRVDQIVKFFSVQLCYSMPTGRLSAIQFLHTIIKKFPIDILSNRAEFLYLSLGTRLVNDDEPECRKAIAECIELLIARLTKVDRQRLFDMTLVFFEAARKASVREMAAALCSRFLNAEKAAFAPHLKVVLPLIVARITLGDPNAPGRFVRAPAMLGIDVNVDDVKRKLKKMKYTKHGKFDKKSARDVENVLNNEDEAAEKTAEAEQRAIDHEIIQMQYCLLKMFEYCAADMFDESQELCNAIDDLAYESQKLLAHEHDWVRCNAAKIIAHILAHFDFEAVGRKLIQSNLQENGTTTTTKLDYIYLNPEYDLKSLILDLCAQMIPGETSQVMIDEIAKIFLYVANMLRDVPFSSKKAEPIDEDGSERQKDDQQQQTDSKSATKINLPWLVRNIRFLINKEVAKAPHCISMRFALFTLIEGLITLLNVETLELLAPSLLAALVREMSEEDQNVDAELRQQALRVGSRMRKRIGADIYDKLRSSVQTKLMMRRAERKKLIAQEKIHDPVRAAKRRESMQERKKISKKRKVQVMRGKAEDVKQKLKKRKRKAEDDIF